MKNTRKNGLILFFALLTVVCTNRTGFAQSHVFIDNGVCDAREVDFNENIVSLAGNWSFFWETFSVPNRFDYMRKNLKLVPSQWNDFNREKKGTGYGTYALKILLDKNVTTAGIEIPQLYSCYALYVNDSLIANNGVIGKSKKEERPQWKPQFVTFPVTSDTISLKLQVSNFHHHKGGIRQQILFGTADNIESHFNREFYSTLILAGLLFGISAVFIVLYMRHGKKAELLYFALFCIAWGIRLLFTDIYPVMQLLPNLNWNFLLRVEYISLFAVMACATVLIHKVFKEYSNRIFTALILVFNGMFTAFTLLASPMLFTHWLNLYLGIAILILIYAATTIVRALLVDKVGAWSLIIGVVLTIFLVGYDLIAFKGLVADNLLIKNIGYGMIYFCLSIGLLQSLSIIKTDRTVERKLTIEDFYNKS